jgi:hypothetical protein
MNKNQLLAHRGYWKVDNEKNSFLSLKSALLKGYGIETDIRDFNGLLVVSHDIPLDKSLYLEELFSFYRSNNLSNFLALNIKSDGILTLLKTMLNKYKIINYCIFDMSIPETIKAKQLHLNFLVRMSDIEENSFDLKPYGVWLDFFYDVNYFKKVNLIKLLDKYSLIILVSHELHKHSPYIYMKNLLTTKLVNKTNLFICTDIPDWYARNF